MHPTKSDYVLLVASNDWRFSMPDLLREDILLIDLDAQHLVHGKNTAIVNITSLPAEYHRVSLDGKIKMSGSEALDRILSHFRITEFFAAKICMEKGLSALFLFVRRPNNLVFIYSSTSYHQGRIMFLNPCPEMQPLECKPIWSLLQQAIKYHHDQKRILNNHNNHNPFIVKMAPDDEIEYKLTLSPPVDIWILASSLWDLIDSGGFVGYVCHWSKHLMFWQFDNYLYEIQSPPEETGYISFIPCPDSSYLVKHKRFAYDQLRRCEKIHIGATVNGSFEDFLADQFPNLAYVRHPPFQRIRYDVEIESLETGNYFSIIFDQCCIKDNRYPPLFQCEVEYCNSRTAGKPSDVFSELRESFDFTKYFLNSHEVSYNEDFYSKLSFVRDCQLS